MRQAIMNRPGQITIREVPDPVVADGEVLVRIHRIGVCGSDIHVWHGKHPYTAYPVVQGHEVSGEIVSLGVGVTQVAPGDRVTIRPQVTCGACRPCREGRYHICDHLKVMGFQTTGLASDLVAVPATNVVRLPVNLPHDSGALVEPLAVACHALGRSGLSIRGRKILVLGGGPIGNLVAQAAEAMHAAMVLLTDISDYRLDIARSCGLSHVCNPLLEDLAERVEALFGPDGTDLILECVGVNATMDQAIRLAGKGTDIIVVGVFGDKAVLDLGWVQDRELRLIGTLMYREEDYQQAIDLLCQGMVNLKPLVTHRFPLENYEQAYAFIDQARDNVMKVMIDLQDP
jgi:L-iditol 2-dehydrogenase